MLQIELIDLWFCLKGKVPNKQDDTWIMSRLIKQLTDMGFPVSAAYLCKYPSVYLTVVPGVYFVILTWLVERYPLHISMINV